MTSLLNEQILGAIGRKTEPQREIVTRRDIRKYAVATGNRQRKHLNGDEAPPLFHLSLFWDVVELDLLTPDGVSIDSLLPRFPLEKAMAGGLHIDYHRPIRPGDWLTAVRTLTDIYEKQGRSGPLIFYEVIMHIRDDAGASVVTEKTTRILR
ncbi:MAG: MaoC family dehydratase N-terminal domain-containing protein [Pseudomonadota bacterium]